jgi:cytochrome c-type biogenesis protein CcsB
MKIFKFLFSPVFMGILLLIFAVSMAVATFLENDFGAGAAYKIVYNTIWFELILVLLGANLFGQIINYKLYKKSKLTVFLFHISFILMIIGAGITRYFGYEGTIHIREGEEQNKYFSSDEYIGYTIKDIAGNVIAEHSKKYTMTSVSADNYKQKINSGNQYYEIVLARIIPNASQVIAESPDGEPIISFVITRDMMSRETVILKKGESKSIFGVSIGFGSMDSADIAVNVVAGSFFIRSKFILHEMSMMAMDSTVFEADKQIPLKPMQILAVKDIKIVPQQMSLAGSLKATGIDPSEQNTGQNAFIFHIFTGNKSATVTLWDKETDNLATGSVSFEGKTFEISFGSKIITLPYSLKLNDFVLERYPGSNSPSGYKSNVILIDKVNNVEKPFTIFMNNILKYKGYRFYQSSFDRDEKGTILSVNHDLTGMLVTYSGYTLLFIFIILSIINKNSVFHKINAGYWQSPFRKIITLIGLTFLLSNLNIASAQKLVPDKKVSEEFGKVLVQDQKGRTKPLFTLSNDILRKVTRKNEFNGLTSMQVFLGLYLDFDHWRDVPLIKVSNRDIQRKIGIRGTLASFTDLVDMNRGGAYKLSADVDKAYSKTPGERNKTDKEVMKIDERINIVFMIFNGNFMKLFPLKHETNDWGTYEEALKTAVSKEDSLYINNIIPMFKEALISNNFVNASQIAVSITDYQARFARYELPSKTRTNAELIYYKVKIFERLFPFYATIGLIMLFGLLISVIRGRKEASIFGKVPGWALFAGFLFHTFGLGLRWYIAGHSPMSNGYESMIFISWVTLLAGFIFSRKSAFALSATAVLASMTLMVAHLSFMDPEITNLVPVLKSYWLTLHVSVITGSYGFLGLGAILGLITMILLALVNDKNRERIASTIDELTVINYQTLTLGLYFLTIGTFLGAVWANESWGRYWGWDPKETWSLITIIIYALVIHSRMIPGMKDIYTFNLLSLFAFSSVLMTYFGVNYYLSGLHSYAGGDPVPVPSFVYIAVITLAAISFIAYLKYTSVKKISEK